MGLGLQMTYKHFSYKHAVSDSYAGTCHILGMDGDIPNSFRKFYDHRGFTHFESGETSLTSSWRAVQFYKPDIMTKLEKQLNMAI